MCVRTRLAALAFAAARVGRADDFEVGDERIEAVADGVRFVVEGLEGVDGEFVGAHEEDAQAAAFGGREWRGSGGSG